MSADNVLFDASTQLLDRQLSAVDGLDTKAVGIFAVASGVAAIVPALVPLASHDWAWRWVAFVPMVLGIVAYAIGVVLFLRTFRLQYWHAGPHHDDLRLHCATYEDGPMRRWVGATNLSALAANIADVRTKTVNLEREILAFLVEIALLVLAAGITFFH